jgi:hypothetical protein
MALIARESDNDSAPVISESDFKQIKTFTGETILFDSISHTYRTLDGIKMVSGSEYAKQFVKPFDKAMSLMVCAKAWGVRPQVIADIWEMNADISRNYGTSLHKALELAHKHYKTGEKIKSVKKGATENYALPKMPHIRFATELFGRMFSFGGMPELFVSDTKGLRVGQIDRLEILDDINKICRVQDYKTTTKMDKNKLLSYQHQMSFYAHILINKGWTVEALDLFNFDGNNWERLVLPVLPYINNKETI